MRGGRGITRRARALRRRPTDAEQRLWYCLRRNYLGFKFRRQFPIPPYFVDFACVDAKLVIEADGGQHAILGEHSTRDAFLTARGWRILRFWNNDILKNQDGVFRIVIEALDARQAQVDRTQAAGQPPPKPSPVSTEEGEPRSGWEGAATNGSISGNGNHPPSIVRSPP